MRWNGGKQGIVLPFVLGLTMIATAGCVGNDSPPAAQPGGGSSQGVGGAGTGVDNVTEFHVDVTEKGYKERQGRELIVKTGDQVRIVLHHAEPYGDTHPIYFTCTERASTVTQTERMATMEFLAESAGTCSFFCINHDCAPHKALQGGKLTIEG